MHACLPVIVKGTCVCMCGVLSDWVLEGRSLFLCVYMYAECEREGGKSQWRWEVVVEDGESILLHAAHCALDHLWACLFLFVSACPLFLPFCHYWPLIAHHPFFLHLSLTFLLATLSSYLPPPHPPTLFVTGFLTPLFVTSCCSYSSGSLLILVPLWLDLYLPAPLFKWLSSSSDNLCCFLFLCVSLLLFYLLFFFQDSPSIAQEGP